MPKIDRFLVGLLLLLGALAVGLYLGGRAVERYGTACAMYPCGAQTDVQWVLKYQNVKPLVMKDKTALRGLEWQE